MVPAACSVCVASARSPSCTHEACKRCCAGLPPCDRHRNYVGAALPPPGHVEAHLRATRTAPRYTRYGIVGFCPPIVCADGMKLSVETGPTLFCQPRDFVGPFSHVEVAVDRSAVRLLDPRLRQHGFQRGSDDKFVVFRYVPISVVEDAIDYHGGLAVAEPGELLSLPEVLLRETARAEEFVRKERAFVLEMRPAGSHITTMRELMNVMFPKH